MKTLEFKGHQMPRVNFLSWLEEQKPAVMFLLYVA